MKNSALNKLTWIGRHTGLSLLLLLLLLLNGCSVSLFNGYQRNSSHAGSTPTSWFQTDTGHFMFNTKIDLLKNHFSGLMVIKPMTDGIFRVVFITEVGLKIFDMEFFPNKPVKVHYIMDAMNKKALIRVLSNDISLLLMNRYAGIKPALLHEKKSGEMVFRFRHKGSNSYYHVLESTGKPYRILQTGRIVNKVKADLYGTTVSGIDSILIAHYNLKLSINLFRITESTSHAAE